MAGSDVQVTFGANIAPLVEGVAGVKSSIDGIAEAAKGLAAAFGVAFSLEGVKNFVEGMADLGAQITKTSSMFGMSTTDVQKFGFIAKASGVDSDSFVQAIGRLQTNLQLAQSGLGPTARALQALGLSARQLAQIPVEQQLLKISEALGKYADGGQKAAIENELVRNGAATLGPVLGEGAERFKSLAAEAVNAGTVMTTKTVAGLNAIEEKGTTLKASLTALGGTLVATSTNLSDFATWLTNASRDMTALASTGTLGEFVAHVASAAWERVGRDVAFAATMMEDFFTASPAKLAADYDAGMKAIADADKKYITSLNSMIDDAIAGYRKLIAAQGGLDTRPQAPPSGAPDTGAAKAAAEQYQTMIKQADDSYALLKQQYAADVAQHSMSLGEENANLERALDERWAIEQAVYARELQGMAQGTAQYNNVLKEQQQSYQNYLKEKEALADEAAKREVALWKSGADQIAGAFNSQLLKMLQGKETFAQASKQIEADLLLDFLKNQIKATAEFLADQARKLASYVATQLGMTASAETSAALRAATDTAASGGSILKAAGQALGIIGADAGQASAGVAANLAPVVGPAAPAAGAAAGASVMATAMGFMATSAAAGHVVMARLFGLSLMSAWIVPAEAPLLDRQSRRSSLGIATVPWRDW